MKSHRAVAVLALIVLLGLVAPLSAESARPVAPEPGFLAPMSPAPIQAASLCPTFFCPVYYPEEYCTCDWIECPNGEIVCGRWNGGTAAASSSATAPAVPAFFAPAVQPAAGGASVPR